eukprot:TRINITY_DN2194_c0_g1_i10.p1 TRINITY_DN2194_c0_g1~~TRINITY_DN2194_c0_g1_i10.p1  ORF type:complete len:248 (+),score=29.70 TRINITY_DN2194_c0_g1_i10:54-797(+)
MLQRTQALCRVLPKVYNNITKIAPLTRMPVRCLNTPNDGFEKQGSYEGPGKTTVSIINQEIVDLNIIDSYSKDGFRLNNDNLIVGPAIIFPTAVLKWKIGSAADITMESLSLFTLLEPKPDVVVIGHGEQPTVRDPVNPRVILGMKKKGISIEAIPTDKAISTYNFLVEEGRVVVAALIPPEYVHVTPDYESDSKKARNELFILDENPAFWDSKLRKQTFKEGVDESRKFMKVIEEIKKDQPSKKLK